jgi:hypothetical protein
MEYSKIVAVTGLPGLYELISSKTDGAVVRSLDDKATRFVSSRIHNFSHLESIEIYTIRDNVNLVVILQAMDASNEKLPDEKDQAALRKYFEKVFGDIDFSRVYSSDLKKMVKWFTVLKNNQIELKIAEPQEEPAVVEEEKKPEPVKVKKAEEKPREKKKVRSEPAEEPKEKKKTKSKAKEKPKKEAAKNKKKK